VDRVVFFALATDAESDVEGEGSPDLGKETEMLQVTEAARGRLLSKLSGRKAADDEVWRFTRKKSGWKLLLDRANPNDVTLTHEGRNVLLLDEGVSRKMTKMTLDATNAGSKPRLTLRTD